MYDYAPHEQIKKYIYIVDMEKFSVRRSLHWRCLVTLKFKAVTLRFPTLESFQDKGLHTSLGM